MSEKATPLDTFSAYGVKWLSLDSAGPREARSLGCASKLWRGRELLEHLLGRAGVVDGDPVLTDGTGVEDDLCLGHHPDQPIVGGEQFVGVTVNP
jgi:hypothetical protein